MTSGMHIRRFGIVHRLFHIFLMVTFLIQAATGIGRLYGTTGWGKGLSAIFGGNDASLRLHQGVGILMIAGFLFHILYVAVKMDRRNLWESFFGPDSLIPTVRDLKDFRQNVRWFFGLGDPPRFDRWTYWEKFDYWAVFWGMPLLAATGLMLMYPLMTSQFLPGWSLNIAALLHRAEAVLAISYIFIVHFSIGHLRPSSFPMSEAMFSGTVELGHLESEKAAWVERLGRENTLLLSAADPPAPWFRVAYFIFGYAALCTGIYLLVNGIVLSGQIRLH